ncbi:MAG: FHA domain-containing protein [Gemmatimonadota bacterium]|nr:FHA domain-containing protein [Gemmatimonadota bacterium]
MPFLELDGNPDIEPREIAGETTVGSGSQATWRIPRMDLAARHFLIRTEGQGSANIVPASPQNVVILNGRQVPPEGSPIGSGDIIGAGSARFYYLSDLSQKRPVPPAAPEAFLINQNEKKGYLLRKRVIQIGREIGCSIVLKDPTVSRFHVDVRAEGGEFVLYSMGSAGTKVNGETATAPKMLSEGDSIEVGATTFVFSRTELPIGVKPTDFEDHTDDSFSRNKTQIYNQAVTGSVPAVRRTIGGVSPMLILLTVVGVVVLVYLLFELFGR